VSRPCGRIQNGDAENNVPEQPKLPEQPLPCADGNVGKRTHQGPRPVRGTVRLATALIALWLFFAETKPERYDD
jgi:hypothetical protein